MESLDNIKTVINNALIQLGYKLCSLKLIKGKPANLAIVIDRETPISLDDITLVSNEISKLLDNHDFISESYLLDISSLGIEKSIDLKNLEKYVNQYINIHLNCSYKGLSSFEGTLISVDESLIRLVYFVKGKKTIAELERKYVDNARLAIKF